MQSFSKVLARANLMSGAIRNRADALAGFSVTAETADKIEALSAKAGEIDRRQEDLKAQLKACTTDLNAVLSELSALLDEAHRRVKVAVPRDDWKAFGIEDKR